MKIRKITAALCALAMAVSLAACGSSGGGSSGGAETDKPVKTVKAEETTAKKSEETAANAETEAPGETAAEAATTEAPEDEFITVELPDLHQSFHEANLVSWSKGLEHPVFPDADDYYAYNGNLYYCLYDLGADMVSVMSFNMSSKEEKSIYSWGGGRNWKVYCKNGKFYCMRVDWEKNKFVLDVIDESGNIIGNLGEYNELPREMWFIFDDGAAVFLEEGAQGKYVTYCSKDRKVELPLKYEEEAEHGLTEEKKFFYLYSLQVINGNFLCFLNNSGDSLYDDLLYYDESKGIWRKYAYEKPDILPKEEYIVTWNGGYYDLSTGEEYVMDFTGNGISYDDTAYYGDNFCIALHDGKWYKVPRYGGDVDFSKYEPMGSESGNINRESSFGVKPLDDKYYIFKDGYGIFLRTYEKGEAEEETVMLFDR